MHWQNRRPENRFTGKAIVTTTIGSTEDAIDGVTESVTERVNAVNASFEQLNPAAQSSSRCQSGEHGRVA